MSELVCTTCFSDEDLKRFIRKARQRGCHFCGNRKAMSAPLDEVADFIKARMETFYGNAVDQLPYDGQEGGYQGSHTDTEDLLFGKIGLDLPKDKNQKLYYELLSYIGDDEWCDHDWLALDYDDSLKSSWQTFCEIIKHQRRFFFHELGYDPDSGGHPDNRSAHQILVHLCGLIDRVNVIREIPDGYQVYRARTRQAGQRFKTAAELGPPPSDLALQSNRMNPPGIPMFYGAETTELAGAEVGGDFMSVGRFKTLRPLRLLDLASLPPVPGFFSTAGREERLGLKFLREFGDTISQPVAGNDRTQVDYIPTQVFTEFLRDFLFKDGHIDGVRYKSATGVKGANIVLFANEEDVCDKSSNGKDDYFQSPGRPWISLIDVRLIESPKQR